MEAFGILGLDHDSDIERNDKEVGIRNNHIQNMSPKLKILIPKVFERMTYFVEELSTAKEKLHLEKEKETNFDFADTINVHIPAYEKLKKQLNAVTEFCNEVDEEDHRILILKSFTEIINQIFESWNAENFHDFSLSSVGSGKLYSEILIQFLEIISDRLFHWTKSTIIIDTDDARVYFLLTEILVNFILNSNRLKISQSVIQTILSTLRGFWNFVKLKSDHDFCSIILKSVMECNALINLRLAIDAINCRELGALLRILLEIFRDTDLEEHFFHKMLEWIIEMKDSEKVITFLTIFTHFAKPAFILQLANSEGIVFRVRVGLLSKSPIERKESLFLLKLLTSALLTFPENEDGSEHSKIDSRTTLIFSSNLKLVGKFWTDFFDLLEILDEKQIHIIKPFLPKLQTLKYFNTIESSSNMSSIDWYLVILKKMVEHDNRFVAREGFINFLETGNLIASKTEPETRNLKGILTEFLNKNLLPVLRESVGWILPEAQDFFETAKKMGFMLTQIFENNLFLISDSIMSFINQFDIGLSPPAIYFLVLSIFYGVFELPIATFNESETSIAQILSSFTRFILKGLSALDKFLRLETQKLLTNIFSKLISFTKIRALTFENALDFDILNFLGALDHFVISRTDSFADFKKRFIKTNIDKLKISHMEKNLTPLQISGFYRFLFLNGSHKILERKTLTCSAEIRNAVLKAHIDFLQFLPPYSTALVSQMRFALRFWKSEQNFLTRNQDNINLFPSFQECQTILELIGEYAAISDSGNELLGIMSYTSEVLDSQSLLLGQNIQNDTELFRFYGILARFLIFHPESSFIQFPATFYLEKFSDLFKQTNISKYDCSIHSLRATFIEKRLTSLSMILQLNLKRMNNKSELGINQKVVDAAMLKSVFDQVDLAGPKGIIPIMEFIRAALSFVTDDDTESIRETMQDFLESSWKGVFEMRKTESFWSGVQEFVRLIVHPYFTGEGLLEKYAREIYDKSENVTGISVILMEAISEVVSNPVQSNMSDVRRYEIIQVCVEAIWFGPPLLKHIKVTSGLWEYIQTQDSTWRSCIPNDLSQSNANEYHSGFNEDSYNFIFNANGKTRLHGIQSIVQIITDSGSEEVVSSVVLQLLDKNDSESSKRRRYFGNSSTHRIKQRIVQALLVLQPKFSQEISETVTSRLMLSLTRDSPQPSVRYLMEWVIIRNLIKFPENHASFFKVADECCKERVGFGTFLSTICLHVSTNLKKQDILVQFSEKALRTLSTLLLGHHFTVRLYAQVCFRRIYETAVSSVDPPPEILNKFEILFENVCLKNCQKTAGNISKISQNIDNEFYVKQFDAEKHYIYEVVFIYLPKFCGVASDELIQEKDLSMIFQRCSSNSPGSPTETKLTFSYDKKIRKLYEDNQKLAWHLKDLSDDGREMGEEVARLIEDSTETINFQKKLNPWKFLSVAPEISDFPEKVQLRKNSANGGLIVVASLIDRAPNLGGLCRTCEIFGVSKFVIAGLKSLEDQQFQNLSVSAQSWVDILEVPVRSMDLFLNSYAQKGYTILGVEQALESVPLHQYIFPKKSVLVLGNEKYGIPPHLLQQVNKCLEIPQFGVVRSLNAHVSGALCIWQYAIQHTVPNC